MEYKPGIYLDVNVDVVVSFAFDGYKSDRPRNAGAERQVLRYDMLARLAKVNQRKAHTALSGIHGTPVLETTGFPAVFEPSVVM